MNEADIMQLMATGRIRFELNVADKIDRKAGHYETQGIRLNVVYPVVIMF